MQKALDFVWKFQLASTNCCIATKLLSQLKANSWSFGHGKHFPIQNLVTFDFLYTHRIYIYIVYIYTSSCILIHLHVLQASGTLPASGPAPRMEAWKKTRHATAPDKSKPAGSGAIQRGFSNQITDILCVLSFPEFQQVQRSNQHQLLKLLHQV